MKKWTAFLFICYLVNSFSQTNISPQFSELKGMEDQQSNTHFFYRIYSYEETSSGYRSDNSIYHLDFNTEIDTLFLREFIDHSYVSFFSISVGDIDFWNENPNQFIFGGTCNLEGVPSLYIRRFENPFQYPNILELGEIKHIDISDNNDSLIYVGLGENSSSFSLGSTDGGWNWNPVFDTLKFISLNPFNDNFLFLENELGFLYRSTDAGSTFNLVDLLNQPAHSTSFIYDPDQLHIYRLYSNQTLRISPNNGEPFSWENKYSSDTEIFISNDKSISGTIYLADKKNILVSTDYGGNFNLYKTLDRKIIGIYQKPDTNKLYAATKYKIYEISPDTIQVIKTLPIPEEVLNFYPLAIGNRWVYDENTVYYDTIPHGSSDILIKEVIGDTIAINGKHYFKVIDQTIWESPVLERVDSTDGMVYRYYEDPSLPGNEYIAYDLLAEVGDTISSFRLGFNTVLFTTMYAETTFEKWGLTKPKKVFEEFTLHPPIFSLTQDIGLDSIYFYFDFGDTWITLKGCVIDGVVYGDTTTVSVEDETEPVASSFKLEQNYPNPFNPTTNIGFRIADFGFVSLKVYDILGNEVATLINEELSAGEYEVEFDAVGLPSLQGSALTSGIYFYTLIAGNFRGTKKLVLLK
jgi:hypothetical protein